ncbi:hypothetical protein Dsin_006005 [Dipteronia sinensis]|uniref:SGNH hydrolase-type esterase domain-containing protein n=1 Tax=Dipteronia sinensis TaxID=43782 RepID=A0AAE0AYE0_9ROSI|nr:hypothetical protein Dsin_006005 [Dipteronia sinensis]
MPSPVKSPTALVYALTSDVSNCLVTCLYLRSLQLPWYMPLPVKSPTALADVLLRGYAGWNSRRAVQILDQVFPKDAAVQPSLVIVYFGGNDSMRPHPDGLGPRVPLPEYIENMRKIALHLKSLSAKTRIIIISPPPDNEQQIRETLGAYLNGSRTNEDCRIYSDACLKLCRELDVKAIDLWTAMQQRDDWLTACFTDGIHLSSEGSKEQDRS